MTDCFAVEADKITEARQEAKRASTGKLCGWLTTGSFIFGGIWTILRRSAHDSGHAILRLMRI